MNQPDIEVLDQRWGAKLLTVSGAASVFSIADTEELGAERIVRLPALFYLFGDMGMEDPKTWDQVTQEGIIETSVFVVAESMRGLRKGRLGGTGSYNLSLQVIRSVVGWEIEPGWKVWLRRMAPFALGDGSKSAIELRFAHSCDLFEYV